MRGKKIAVLLSTAALLASSTFTMLTVAGGASLLGGCSADRSDTRQDARTSTRTEERVKERHD